jgi:hypothetical protein
MKSHQYADKLQELAKFLLDRPEFIIPHEPFLLVRHDEKRAFLEAVSSLGAGKKEFSNERIKFTPSTGPKGIWIEISAPRDKVCTLISPPVYDCEPFLSPEEEEQVGR